MKDFSRRMDPQEQQLPQNQMNHWAAMFIFPRPCGFFIFYFFNLGLQKSKIEKKGYLEKKFPSSRNSYSSAFLKE
jgi:hypothetical protein